MAICNYLGVLVFGGLAPLTLALLVSWSGDFMVPACNLILTTLFFAFPAWNGAGAGQEQEHALHQALDTIAHWRIAGQKLELLDEQGAVVLGLESRYLN